MREMKDSGVKWIGKIPRGWDVNRGKYIFKYVQKPVREDDGVITCFRDGEVTLRSRRREEGFTMSDKEIGYQGIDIGDLIVHGMDGFAGAIGISDSRGKASPVLNVLDTTQDKKYYMYFLRAAAWSGLFISLATGIRVRTCDTNWGKLRDIWYVLPSKKEQHAIASFLDTKCGEIDALYADIQSEIDTLEAYKRSVITEAVTKGLDKNVAMKDSGIEWDLMIPYHWNAIPFKNVLYERNERNNPVKTDERLSLSIGLGVTTYAEKTTNLDRFKEDVSQYKLAHIGDLVMNSMNMIVGATGVSKYFGCVSPAYYTFYDSEQDHVIAKYCEYLFLTPLLMGELHKLGKGIMFIERGDGKVNTCRLKVSRYDLGHLLLPIPPLNEMRTIVAHLNSLSAEIDSIIAQKKEQLAILADYKKSIIYEYVTGKKEVPSA